MQLVICIQAIFIHLVIYFSGPLLFAAPPGGMLKFDFNSIKNVYENKTTLPL